MRPLANVYQLAHSTPSLPPDPASNVTPTVLPVPGLLSANARLVHHLDLSSLMAVAYQRAVSRSISTKHRHHAARVTLAALHALVLVQVIASHVRAPPKSFAAGLV